MNERWAIYNGELIKADQPAVSVSSRGLMYGDGCFDTFRTYGGAYFKVDTHLQRLEAGADFLSLEFPFALSETSVKESVNMLIEKNKILNGHAVGRIQLWRSGSRGYSLTGEEETRYALLVSPLPDFPSSIHLSVADIRRIPDRSLPSDLKLCNNINYITAARQAADCGADDALMLDVEGCVSETTIGNLFWVTGTTVYTPATSCDLLTGITRETLLELIQKQTAFTVREGRYSVDHIKRAEAVWMCNSVRGLIPVAKIDQQEFESDHAVFSALNKVYKSHVERSLTK